MAAPTFAFRAPVVPPAAQTYLWPGGGHWVSSNVERGRYILLEDRSLWEIDSLDRLDAMLWLTTDPIVVVASSGCVYGYRLINPSDTTTACARFLSFSR